MFAEAVIDSPAEEQHPGEGGAGEGVDSEGEVGVGVNLAALLGALERGVDPRVFGVEDEGANEVGQLRVGRNVRDQAG